MFTMRRIALIVFVVFVRAAPAAINLSPVPTEYESQGFHFTRLSFSDNQRRITYVPPLSWSYRGSASQVQLTPQKAVDARAMIEAIPLATPKPPDAETMKLAREQFVAALPLGSQKVTLLSEQENPILLGGTLPSYELTASYQIWGLTFVRSTLFVNLADAQLRFRLTARQADFDGLHQLFQASILSWQWTDAQGKQGAGPVTVSDPPNSSQP